VHLVAAGDVGNEGHALASSPMLAMVIEALVRSYDHVVIDIGSAADIELERFAPLAPRAVLVAADSASPATKAARELLLTAGMTEVTLMIGVPQEIAA
jgi:tyrosine-protein kinase Etk/Wzc